jgi:hypothetical protein
VGRRLSRVLNSRLPAEWIYTDDSLEGVFRENLPAGGFS